jgi:hypothetical protein
MTQDDGSAYDPRETVSLHLRSPPATDGESGGLSLRLLAAASLAAASRAQRSLVRRQLLPRLLRR